VVTSAEGATPEPRGACVASFRIDMSKRIWPFLVPATLFISLGALGVCMAFVTHGPLQPYAGTITLGGSACMLAGLILAIFVARPVLTHDEYLAALETGLLCKLDGGEKFLPWSAVEAVRWDAATASVHVLMREGEPLVVARQFGSANGDVVAAKLDDVRRKADFHLL
jgi:hypothetical protein